MAEGRAGWGQSLPLGRCCLLMGVHQAHARDPARPGLVPAARRVRHGTRAQPYALGVTLPNLIQWFEHAIAGNLP